MLNNLFIGEKRMLQLTKLKSTICKTAHRCSIKNAPKTNLRNQYVFFWCTCHMPDTGKSARISFLSTSTYLHKIVCFLNSWKQSLVSLKFCLGEIIDLIYAARNEIVEL